MVLLREISQHLTKKLARENAGLEIWLWLEKEDNEKAKILSLKSKACIKFKGKINSMSTFEKIWIDGYGGVILGSLTGHCNGKSHMKTLRSFKVSVLKMPAEVGRKEVDTDVSLEEFKRLKTKAKIAYSVIQI